MLDRQPACSAELQPSFDSFDPFNLFDRDIFDFWRLSSDNSATYGSADLAWVLPVIQTRHEARLNVSGSIRLGESTMLDHLLRLQAGRELQERSNKVSGVTRKTKPEGGTNASRTER